MFSPCNAKPSWLGITLALALLFFFALALAQVLFLNPVMHRDDSATFELRRGRAQDSLVSLVVTAG